MLILAHAQLAATQDCHVSLHGFYWGNGCQEKHFHWPVIQLHIGFIMGMVF